MGNVKTQIKKVKPYPFPATIDRAGVKSPVEVMMLTERGFIARLTTAIFKVGDSCTCEFEIPVLKTHVLSPLRVIKTYDRAADGKTTKVERLAEFHFDKPTADLTKAIHHFMSQIGQK